MVGAADEREAVGLSRAAQRAYCKEQAQPTVQKWQYGDKSLGDRRRRSKAYYCDYKKS